MLQARVAPAQTHWDKVRKLSAAHRNAFTERNLEKLLGLYASNPRAIWAEMPAAEGKPAIRALLKRVFEAGLSDTNLELCALRLRGDVAIEVGYAKDSRRERFSIAAARKIHDYFEPPS
jgi:ketosteroid isomerase-like protein